MPKLAVIHLSDIHAHSSKDDCFDRVNDIACVCFQDARDADACLIAITGDIAFSGQVQEYEAIHDRLIRPLVNKLYDETKRPVYVSLVPGNHDCILKPANEVRETIIKAIVEEPSKAENEQMVELCAQVQSNFFQLCEKVLSPAPSTASKLFWQQEFKVGEKCVRISSLNVAWMSRLPERQGQLVFPIARFENQLSDSACLHLALVHHPFNWFSQSAYHQLRRRLRHSCTAVLSGHEHYGNVGKVEEQLSGTSLFFEASALQPHEPGTVAGFSIHLFDLDKKTVVAKAYSLENKDIRQYGDVLTLNWNDENIIHGALEITSDFAIVLNDAGGNFTHSVKERITLEDVFVWPDVRTKTAAGTQETASAKGLINYLEQSENFVLFGDEKSGKTTLLLWIFRELTSRGYAPVYLSASELQLKAQTDPEKRIARAIAQQYKNPEIVQRLPKSKKLLLVDDVDRFKSGTRMLPELIEYAQRHFTGVCMTAASGFEVTNLADEEAASALADFEHFELRKFGRKLRHQLIKKWCTLSEVSTKPDLDKRIDDVETIVNSVIGKQLVPEHPIYLLILLQSCEQHRHGEIQNSGLSYYYQYLITKSLGEVGVKPIELDEHFNYLSILAWNYKQADLKEMDIVALDVANRDFSDRFVTVDLSERLALLTRARILMKRGDCYSFTYPYIYYFFVGRYLARNLEQPDIKNWVEDACKRLYLRDRAQAIMFLTHHVENKWVIDLIRQVLRECFADKDPVKLDADTAFLNELVEKTSQLTLAVPDVEKNQSEVRSYQDSIVQDDTEIDADEYGALSFNSKWNLLHKTAEILGLILKNHYGSLERSQKKEMIEEVFDGPLRAFRLWLEVVSDRLPKILLELKTHERAQNRNVPDDQIEKRVKRHLFNLLGLVATGTIASAAGFVAAEKLREDIAIVVSKNPTNAYRLISAATRLLKPGTVPVESIRKLAEDLDKNPYAFGVLQSLAYVHMYMFHTEEQQKQALCSALKISFRAAKAIEINKPGRIAK